MFCLTFFSKIKYLCAIYKGKKSNILALFTKEKNQISLRQMKTKDILYIATFVAFFAALLFNFRILYRLYDRYMAFEDEVHRWCDKGNGILKNMSKDLFRLNRLIKDSNERYRKVFPQENV